MFQIFGTIARRLFKFSPDGRKMEFFVVVFLGLNRSMDMGHYRRGKETVLLLFLLLPKHKFCVLPSFEK